MCFACQVQKNDWNTLKITEPITGRVPQGVNLSLVRAPLLLFSLALIGSLAADLLITAAHCDI